MLLQFRLARTQIRLRMHSLVYALTALLLVALPRPGLAKESFSCTDCLRVAKTLESELLKLEQADQPATSSLVGNVLRRRRLSHPRSETQIFSTLDTICEKVGTLKPGCVRLVQEHRNDLENDIYAEGIEHVRRLLCSDFSSLCPMHALYDTGEL